MKYAVILGLCLAACAPAPQLGLAVPESSVARPAFLTAPEMAQTLAQGGTLPR